MKRVITVVVVMALLLVGAPWVIGNIAEDRVNRTLDGLVEAAPTLGIVDRSYTRGWFRSEQEVTFEVLGGATRPLGAPARFTVHNEILHGPLLGFSGLGIARVNSKLVLDPQIRRAFAEHFGSADPLEVSTRIGFLGGGKTTFSMDAREVKHEDGSTIGWDDFVLDVSWSANFDSIGMKGDWPRFEGRDPKSKSFVRLEDAVLDVSSQRVKGHLYQTDGSFSLRDLTFANDGVAPTRLEKLAFVVDTTDDGDFMSVATRFGSGAISGGLLQAQGAELTAMHYDLTLRRLHTGTLVSISNAIAESYQHPGAVSLLEDDFITLLGHEPELLIDRVGFETKDGAAYLKGVIKLVGVTPKDLKMGALSLIAKFDADLRFEAPQKVIEGIHGGREAMMGAVEGGYAELQGDRVVSHLEFHAGELKINGKVQGIPGLGAPPADKALAPE